MENRGRPSENTVKPSKWVLETGNMTYYYDVKKNPLTWLDTMLNGVEHMNFFEGRATEYSKASTRGTWGEVFA